MLVIWTTRGIWIGVPEDLVRCSRLMRIADHSWQVLENRDVSADEAIAAAVSPDGRLAALSLPSKKVRIHDLETDEEVAIFEVEEARSVAISACSFSLDGRVLITANMFSVRTWDAKSWRQSQELDVASDSELRTRDVQACALSPDGSIVALTHPDMIRLCDARDGVVLGEIRGHSAIVEGCSFSPDGTTIASCSRDGTVRLWSTEAVLSRRTAQAGNYSALPKQAPMFGVATPEWERFPSVTACAFSMDGTMVAVGRLDNRIQLLDSASLADLHPERYSHVIRACDFSPDDRRLALGHDDGSLEIIGVADLHDRAHCRGMAHVHAVTACRFSPDGSLLLSASEDRLLKVWDASTGVLVTVLRGHSGVVSDCAWSPDGRTILSSSLDGTVRIWDAGAGRDVAVLEGHECPVRACSYSPDGARVLSGDTNGILCVWGVRRRILTHRLAGHWGSISRCHWSRDGRLLFSASADGTCRLWMPRDGKMITVFAAGGPVSAFAVAGDGRRFVVGDNERGISLVQVENV
jgi:WD40 repeat protein